LWSPDLRDEVIGLKFAEITATKHRHLIAVASATGSCKIDGGYEDHRGHVLNRTGHRSGKVPCAARRTVALVSREQKW